MALRNKRCLCGSPVFKRGACEFCYWCETQLAKGGEFRRHRETLPQPVVVRIPEWHEVVEALRALHGNVRFWAQRDSGQERFNALFRRGGMKTL